MYVSMSATHTPGFRVSREPEGSIAIRAADFGGAYISISADEARELRDRLDEILTAPATGETQKVAA